MQAKAVIRAGVALKPLEDLVLTSTIPSHLGYEEVYSLVVAVSLVVAAVSEVPACHAAYCA